MHNIIMTDMSMVKQQEVSRMQAGRTGEDAVGEGVEDGGFQVGVSARLLAFGVLHAAAAASAAQRLPAVRLPLQQRRLLMQRLR